MQLQAKSLWNSADLSQTICITFKEHQKPTLLQCLLAGNTISDSEDNYLNNYLDILYTEAWAPHRPKSSINQHHEEVLKGSPLVKPFETLKRKKISASLKDIMCSPVFSAISFIYTEWHFFPTKVTPTGYSAAKLLYFYYLQSLLRICVEWLTKETIRYLCFCIGLIQVFVCSYQGYDTVTSYQYRSQTLHTIYTKTTFSSTRRKSSGTTSTSRNIA